MSDNPKHVTVRLRVPPELRDKIADSANAHNRSMNADMVARLEKSFEESALISSQDYKKATQEMFNEYLEVFMKQQAQEIQERLHKTNIEQLHTILKLTQEKMDLEKKLEVIENKTPE